MLFVCTPYTSPERSDVLFCRRGFDLYALSDLNFRYTFFGFKANSLLIRFLCSTVFLFLRRKLWVLRSCFSSLRIHSRFSIGVFRYHLLSLCSIIRWCFVYLSSYLHFKMTSIYAILLCIASILCSNWICHPGFRVCWETFLVSFNFPACCKTVIAAV